MRAIVIAPLPRVPPLALHAAIPSRSPSVRAFAAAVARPIALVAVAAGLILVLLPAAVAAVTPLAAVAV